jgi:hypothetical protein
MDDIPSTANEVDVGLLWNSVRGGKRAYRQAGGCYESLGEVTRQQHELSLL